jgi:hypothetical protein
VGKLTIARALSRLTGAVVVDNHWINDPILKLVTSDDSTAVSEAIWPLVAKVREAVLETIAALGPPGTSYIFTYAGADEDPGDRKALQEYRDVATRRNSRFVPVRVLCSEEESVKRIQSFERRGKKLIDPGETIENFRNYTPLDPRMPETLTLDVTNLSPEAAALAIIAHMESTNA